MMARLAGWDGISTGDESDCEDGIDNDGDGLIDHPDDPGCEETSDTSEQSPLLVCDDGDDNDGDTLIDYPDDPGCFFSTSKIEDPGCQDGVDNDGDGKIDFDGGLSALGYAAADPQPQCCYPWQINERSCGVGAELALLLPPLMCLYRCRSARALLRRTALRGAR
jgi:hypothetical protein